MQILNRTLMAALAIAVLAFPARAETAPSDKAAIEAIVRDYLLAHPEVIEEAIEKLQQQRQEEAVAAQTKVIDENRASIFDSANQVVLGNPQGKITLVEFFDYNCGYCKRALSDMTALIEANPDLRVVLKEFPILSEESVEAARLSVAVKDSAPESYMNFHQELFSRPGQVTGQKALEVARNLGLDADALTKAANATGVTDNLEEVQKLAQMLGISGTPAYVVGSEIVPGAVGYDALQSKVAAMRQCGATVC